MKLQRVVCAVAAFCLLASAARAADEPIKDQVWFETRIAEITIGYDAALKEPRQRAIYLAFVGPKDAIPNPLVARLCAEKTVRPLRNDLVDSMHAAKANGIEGDPTIADTKKQLGATTHALLQISLNIQGRFFACTAEKHAPAVSKSDFYLSLVQRDCTKKICNLSGTQRSLSDSRDAPVFTALYEWLAAKGAFENRNVTNQFFRLKFKGGTNDDSVILSADFQKTQEINKWQDPLDPKELAKQQEALIEMIRKENVAIRAKIENSKKKLNRTIETIEGTAALVADATRADIIQTADVFSNPVRAVALARVTGDALYAKVSNEIARSRLMECRFYRGLSAIGDIAQCAGYKLDNPTLQRCLSGLSCTPDLGDTASAEAFLIGGANNLSDLAQNSILPRYKMPETYSQLKAKYDACAPAGATEAAVSACFMKSTIASDPNVSKISACLEDKAHAKDCAITAFAPPGASAVLDCYKQPTDVARRNCVLASTLPPDAQKLFDCGTKATRRSQLSCLQSMIGGTPGKFLECRNSGAAGLALAACMAPDSPAKTLFVCVSQGGSEYQIATCALAPNLDPKLQNDLACVTSSGGNPYAVGACIAGNELKLNPNQQLAMQCLAMTGGEPESFAACVAGQMTMKELHQCRGKSFGEGNCFGSGNEFQKLAKFLTGSEISSNSVVGQIVDVHLKAAEAVLSVTQPIIDGGMAVLSDVADHVTRMTDDLKGISEGKISSVVDAAKEAIIAPTKVAAKVVDEGRKAVKRIFGF